MHLYGKNPVIERLRAKPETIRKIYLQEGHQDAALIFKKAHKKSVPVLTVPKSKIQKMARNLNTQGVLAQVTDYEYVSYEDLLDKAVKKKLTLVFIDELNDPQNLGGIIRSAACLGNFGIVLPTHESVSVTETVLRVAAGGENYVEVAQVANLKKAIAQAQREHITVVGSVVDGGENIYEIDLPLPVALVFGSEQKGIRPIIQKELDLRITVPMNQNTLSLNVAHAAMVFFYEVTKQKIRKKA